MATTAAEAALATRTSTTEAITVAIIITAVEAVIAVTVLVAVAVVRPAAGRLRAPTPTKLTAGCPIPDRQLLA